MLFDSWQNLGRVALTGLLAYGALILFLRISGKRTLSKMNAFDLVVTVALGSTLSAVLVSQQTPLADGLLALALLIGLQYLVAWTSLRAPWFEDLVKSTPTLLVYRGEVRQQAVRGQRVSTEEIKAAVRSAGLPAVSAAGAVVLETDGSISVIPGEALPLGERLLDGFADVDATDHRDRSGAAERRSTPRDVQGSGPVP
jgi:uncharacterized membrane protein YcaP (DUF421 family)